MFLISFFFVFQLLKNVTRNKTSVWLTETSSNDEIRSVGEGKVTFSNLAYRYDEANVSDY